MNILKEKKKALQKLAQCDGHDFLTPEVGREIASAFNLPDPVIKAQDKRSEFKGLYVPSVKEGDWVEGVPALRLAMDICSAEHVSYNDFFGQGSQFSECITQLKKHFNI